MVLALLVVLTGFNLADLGGANPPPSSHVVDIRQLKFQPAELIVAVGDTVVWINRDIIPHTASGRDDDWSSGELKTNGSWRIVASSQGEQLYYCEYHPNMRASIVVK